MGIEYKEETGESFYVDSSGEPPSPYPKKSLDNKAFYFQNQLKLFNQVFATAGFRIDDSEFGTDTTYKVALAYLLRPTGTKFKGTWGAGFKAPSLYQLYAPPIPAYWFLGGNPNLKPEKSKSFDLGIEQHLLEEKLFFSFVYFHNDYNYYITYYTDPETYMSTYKNIEKADAKGFEAELGINPLENLTISANYTRTDTRDETNGGPLLYRPRNLSSVVANYVFQKKFQAKIILNYVGERLDYTSGNNTIGKPYTRVDLAGSYTINEHVQLFLRIENLFNTNYQDVRGYDTPGISAFGGVKLSF